MCLGPNELLYQLSECRLLDWLISVVFNNQAVPQGYLGLPG